MTEYRLRQFANEIKAVINNSLHDEEMITFCKGELNMIAMIAGECGHHKLALELYDYIPTVKVLG